MREFYAEFGILMSYFKGLALLLARLALAFGFSQPAMMKINDLKGTAEFFETLSIPFSSIFALIVPSFEGVGIVLLFLGLFTRFISIFLSMIMIVAIYTVHWSNGFSVGDNGFEIPLYYLIFSMIFISFGAGRYSIDNLLFKRDKNDQK